MIRGLFMMPTRGMSMMRGFLVIAHLMVFGGFLVMPRGVPILFGRFLVLLRSLDRHDISSHERLCHTTTRLSPPQGVDTLQAQSFYLWVWRLSGIPYLLHDPLQFV